jgi:hypothetical protein
VCFFWAAGDGDGSAEGRQSARLVMRRESKPGGPGTTVILNTHLRGKVGVAKHAEKALRVTCFSDTGAPVTYLMKVSVVIGRRSIQRLVCLTRTVGGQFKKNEESDTMLKEVEKYLAEAAAAEGSEVDATPSS